MSEPKSYERNFKGVVDQEFDLGEAVINDPDMDLTKKVNLMAKVHKMLNDTVRTAVTVENVKIKSPEGYREVRQLVHSDAA